METSASSRLNLPKSRRESELHPQCFGREYGGCPERSIPVQRMSTDPNNPRQKKHRRKQQSPRTRTKHSNTTDPADPSAGLPHQYPVVEGGPTLTGAYTGEGAIFSVNAPVIADLSYEFSLSQLWIVAGDSSNIDTAEVGWHNSNIEYEVAIYVEFDAQIPGWALVIDNTVVGYWPSIVYNTLQISADSVEFGGEIAPATIPTYTAMGSGAFPSQGYPIAACQRNVFYVDSAGNSFDSDNIVLHVTNLYCYTLLIEEEAPSNEWASFFFFGGPGALNPACVS
ncbi:unnamed protein product [Sphagnum jensenii]